MSQSGIAQRLRGIRAIAHEVIEHAPHHRHEWQETLADHARHLGTSTGQRVRLVTHALLEEAHGTASRIKNKGKRMQRNVRANVILFASRKLVDLAERLEKKAKEIK